MENKRGNITCDFLFQAANKKITILWSSTLFSATKLYEIIFKNILIFLQLFIDLLEY